MTNYPNTLLFIDGTWRPSIGGKTIPVCDPSSGMEIGTVACADTADLDLALSSAQRGFDIWRQTSAIKRSHIMRRAAELLRDRKDEIAHVLTLEQGKPVAEARAEILAGADIIDWFAGESQRTYGQVIPSRTPGVLQLALKFPVGPVAAFTPWNFPINQLVRKLAAALAAGCSIIVKAPEETPAAPAALLGAFAEAGVPQGVINLVFGVPADISAYLIPHPIIRKVSFTGSTAVGKHLASLAGLHMKRVTMELGGHAPVIVAADADLGLAVDLMVPFKFRNAGQVCISPTRFIVADDVAAEFTQKFVQRVENLQVGNGLDPDTQMGPVANERRILALEALIADAVARGGRLVAGGNRIGNAGFFFEPTVLVDVPIEAKIMNDEPFGPVAIINGRQTLDAAIVEANRLPFGLAGYGFTRDGEIATRLGNEVEVGMMSINHIGLALPELPFGGVKESGYGTEGGSEAIESYIDTRLVTRRG